MSTPNPTSGTNALVHVRPTKRTLFWRTFVPWQLLRFLVINLRMTRMIMRSHDTRVIRADGAPPRGRS
jgi:hypothetical protein